MMKKMFAATLAVLLCAAAASASAQSANAASSGEDRYIGYYYPKPTTETFESSMKTLDNVDRAQRVQFVTVISQGTIQAAYRVPYAVFVKGTKADKLIIVGMQQGELGTIYRMRALLANMTTMSRLSPFFQEHTVAEDATFFDLLKILGFRDVTITDGDKIAHQVIIK